jgi:hypothetical protein
LTIVRDRYGRIGRKRAGGPKKVYRPALRTVEDFTVSLFDNNCFLVGHHAPAQGMFAVDRRNRRRQP